MEGATGVKEPRAQGSCELSWAWGRDAVWLAFGSVLRRLLRGGVGGSGIRVVRRKMS